jgi:hypothetical protein
MFASLGRIAQIWAAVFGALPPRRSALRSASPPLRLEPLSDRMLLSADFLAGLPFSPLPLNQSALSIVSRVEAFVMTGDDAGFVQQTSPGGLSSQAKAAKASVRSALSAEAPPVVAAGELTVAAENFPVLDFQFGTTAEVVLVFRQPGAAAPQGSGTGRGSDLLGAGIAVHTQAGDECYFVDFDHFSKMNAMNARLASEWDGAASTTARGPREARAADGSGLGRNSSPETPAPVGVFDPGPTNRPNGGRIADGLARPEDGFDQEISDKSENGEINILDADADVIALVTAGWDLPEASQQLVPLGKMDHAVVPAYIVEDGRGADASAAPAETRDDKLLSNVVVGLDEPPPLAGLQFPTSVERPGRNAAMDRLFHEMVLAEDAEDSPIKPLARRPGTASPSGTDPRRLDSQGENVLAGLPQSVVEQGEAAMAVLAEAFLTFGVWRLTNQRTGRPNDYNSPSRVPTRD